MGVTVSYNTLLSGYIRTLITVVLHFLFEINTVHFSLRCSRRTH